MDINNLKHLKAIHRGGTLLSSYIKVYRKNMVERLYIKHLFQISNIRRYQLGSMLWSHSP